MAEHIDEKIIEMTDSEEKTQAVDKEIEEFIRQSVKDCLVKIKGQEIKFEEKNLFEDRVIIKLPVEFQIMYEEMASLKYPSERRPNLIYTNEDGSINVAFNLTNNKIDNEQMEVFNETMQEILMKVQPSAQWLESGVCENNDKNIGFFDFITAALDTNIYNFIFTGEIDGRALMCTFNCIEEVMEGWKFIARGIMDTFFILPKKK